jgi:short-subunit dehydrogenase
MHGIAAFIAFATCEKCSAASFQRRYKFCHTSSSRPAKAGKLSEEVLSALHFCVPIWRQTMYRELRGLRMIITGASSGIGRCLAEKAIERGIQVALTARSADRIHALADELTERGGRAIGVPADITQEADRTNLLDAVVEQYGGLDVLVNNAGVAGWGHFASASEQILRDTMEVNFFAPAELMRRAVPFLLKGRTPAIVNVASKCGRRGLPAWTEYSASKFALCGLTEALRGEFARFDIDVLLILPGLTNSGLFQRLLRNEGRLKIEPAKGMSPETVAAGILHALEHNRAETVLGREARWLLRVNRFFPRLVDRLMARKVRSLYAE